MEARVYDISDLVGQQANGPSMMGGGHDGRQMGGMGGGMMGGGMGGAWAAA